jgi:hypothetical protein
MRRKRIGAIDTMERFGPNRPAALSHVTAIGRKALVRPAFPGPGMGLLRARKAIGAIPAGPKAAGSPATRQFVEPL